MQKRNDESHARSFVCDEENIFYSTSHILYLSLLGFFSFYFIIKKKRTIAYQFTQSNFDGSYREHRTHVKYSV